MRPIRIITAGAVLATLQTASGAAQLLGGQIDVPIVEDIARDIERDVERALENDLELETVLPQVPIPMAEALPEADLPILTGGGETAFVEVTVEDGWRAVQREWLVLMSPENMAALEQAGVTILERTQLASVGVTIARVRVPAEIDSRQALLARLPGSAVQILDRNHVYAPQLTEEAGDDASPEPESRVYEGTGRLGMIDSRIETDHPAFAGKSIITRNFTGDDLVQPDAHGTAVASRFIGEGAGMNGLAPNVSLYAASVFYAKDDYRAGATTAALVAAIDWLMAEEVSVINMSLAGPPNVILEQVLTRALDSGIAVVAAVGNEGPAAPPLYPGAYPRVIAVTAIDADLQAYRWAGRGKHVDFAASGVSVRTARAGGEYGYETGTSLAAPVVASLVLRERAVSQVDSDTAYRQLVSVASDLGAAGHDDIYGHGHLKEK